VREVNISHNDVALCADIRLEMMKMLELDISLIHIVIKMRGLGLFGQVEMGRR
jgi:hypothetical protein